MTNRKIDWGGYKPMSDAEKKCANQQQYAITALVIMTGMNMMFGALMVYGAVSVWLGMILAFSVMIIIGIKAQRDLLDDDETMWESSDKFRSRR
jgi:hypothetical protein